MLTSLQNPRVKEAVHLRDRRDRERTGLFLIEGYRELLRASDGLVEVQRLFYCDDLFLGSQEHALIEKWRALGTEILPCSESVFRKLSYRDRP
ncbi:MAG: RNA methyltransferase, partial [Chlamydiia bacterium]|nr:RNA methyltransferase [Chlamydiia bacterium]